MIEMNRLPLVLVVTAFAPGTVAPGVNVLNLVAIHTQGADTLVALANMACRAGDGRVCALERKFCRWCVTSDARHCFVLVPELEIRKCMIECLAVQLDDVGVSSLVIGMTMVAFLFCGIRLAPMESLACRTIRSNFFVALKAEPRLGSSRERLVTVAALLLQLDMSIDELSRHDKLFE